MSQLLFNYPYINKERVQSMTPFNPKQNDNDPIIFGTIMISARNFTCHLTKTKRMRQTFADPLPSKLKLVFSISGPCSSQPFLSQICKRFNLEATPFRDGNLFYLKVTDLDKITSVIILSFQDRPLESLKRQLFKKFVQLAERVRKVKQGARLSLTTSKRGARLFLFAKGNSLWRKEEGSNLKKIE